MKIIKIKLYKFDELSEAAKQKAIEHFSDINVAFDWWDPIYEDATESGLKITGFDLNRASYVKAHFITSASECADYIIKEYDETSELYETAQTFINDYDQLVEKYSDGIDKNRVAEDNENDFDHDVEDLEDEFLKDLCEDYRIILQKDYDYLTSKEAIIETIEANEYDFKEDGSRL